VRAASDAAAWSMRVDGPGDAAAIERRIGRRSGGDRVAMGRPCGGDAAAIQRRPRGDRERGQTARMAR